MRNQDIFKLLCDENGFVLVQACAHQTWKTYRAFSCLGSPKENDLLLYVHCCKVTYSMKNGEVFSANHGDVVLIPSGKEYTLTIDERDEDYGCTYGINFLTFNEEHERVFLKDPMIICNTDSNLLHNLFRVMSLGFRASVRSCAHLKALFYEIIANLNEKSSAGKRKNFSVIEKGIRYLESDSSLSLTVAQIAEMCCVSQNYFSRLFKEYSGFTPGEYILRAKIEKAKILLRETVSPVSEIADLCGFLDASYFCRIFKKKMGISPLQFRQS